MKISGNDIRPGNVIEYDGSLWVTVKTNKVKPGKGPAYNQVELKNIIDGRKLNNRFGSDERVERARIDHKDFQYLYKDGDQLVFMDNDTYEQINLAEDFVGERAAFLQDGMTVS
ncbi:MAG TPA: elongation factor P, partial [Afifellaceae bacterium]|nr:elongation factor P [Afifellaceae bacterium]